MLNSNPFKREACLHCGEPQERTLFYHALGSGFARDADEAEARQHEYLELLASISPRLLEAAKRGDLRQAEHPVYRRTPNELRALTEREVLLLLCR